MVTVQLRISDSDCRQQVAEMLPKDCEALVELEGLEDDTSSIDLFIVDRESVDLRQTEDGAGNPRAGGNWSIPILLVVPRADFSSLAPAVWEQVDEVIGTPLHESELKKRVQSLGRDRSDQEETEHRLRRQRRQLVAAQRIAGLGSWERDLERDELSWSEPTYRIFGLDPDDELDYETFMAAVHPEDRDALRAQQERLMEEGTPIDIEYRIERPDGEQRILHERGEAEVGPDGEPVRFYGAVLDITERIRRERHLARLRKKYEAVLEKAPDAIFVAEAETGRIVEANAAAASLLEASVDEIVGRHQAELHPLGKGEAYRSLFAQHKLQAEEGTEIRGRLPDGSEIYVESNSGDAIPVEISATFLEFDDETFFIGIFRDVTRRPQYESASGRR